VVVALCATVAGDEQARDELADVLGRRGPGARGQGRTVIRTAACMRGWPAPGKPSRPGLAQSSR